MRTQDKRRGPLAAPGRVRVTVYLDETLADWGKHQEGGLSDLMRRLLADAHARKAGGVPVTYPPEVRAHYERLINLKLSDGLSLEQEAELTQVREIINALDRENARWQAQERASAVVDDELARLRRDIEALPPR